MNQMPDSTSEIQFFKDLFCQTVQPIAITDLNRCFLFCNPAFETLTGYSEEELTRITFEDLTVDSWNAIVEPKISEVKTTGKSTRYEKEYRHKDGRIIPVELVVDLYRASDGTPRYLFAFVTDITQRKKVEQERDGLFKREQEARQAAEVAEKRNAFLAQASALLVVSLDYESTLQRFAELAVPKLADLCIVWILGENNSIRPLALYHSDPERRKLAEYVVRRYPPSPERGEGVMRVIASGSAILQSEIPPGLPEQIAQSDEHLAYLKIANFQSYIGVPLKARDRTLGAISFFITDSGRRYTQEDLAFAQEVADRAGIAIDNARLFTRLKRSVEEKEILLRELHHRVKNNLQVISSLLSLQSAKLSDPRLNVAFEDSRSRIRSMALIHEKLYDTGDLSRIDFGDYLRTLAQHLAESYGIIPGQKVLFKVQAESYLLNINQAVPLGLIANELISNAFKYAFPEREGEVAIELKDNGNGITLLAVKDNGVGFPPGLNTENTITLGLRLVRLLVRQLDGEVQVVNSEPGVCMKILFPRE
jgi:PAS domain S-box-containing protein